MPHRTLLPSCEDWPNTGKLLVQKDLIKFIGHSIHMEPLGEMLQKRRGASAREYLR